MRGLFTARTLIVGCAALLATSVAAERAIPSHAQTFRDFEHHHSGAARIDVARHSLNRLVPAGTGLTEAKARLTSAGAYCGAAASCTFAAFDSHNDMPQSVVWNIDLHHDAGVVSGLSVNRETFGS